MPTHSITATLIGGPTLLIEVGGLRLLTDPTFDEPRTYPQEVPQAYDELEKFDPPALSSEELGRVDVVLLSHDHHEDNLDSAGREYIKDIPLVYTTALGAERLESEAIGWEPGEQATLDLPDGGTITITAVEAEHGPDGVWQAIGPVIGFILEGDVPTTYVSGDNSSVDVVRRIAKRWPDVELAVLFCGDPGFDQVAGGAAITFSSHTALEVTDVWAGATILPVHYSQWKHFREGADGLRATFEAGGRSDRLRVLEPGVPAVVAGATVAS